jgi:hypothetical protein
MESESGRQKARERMFKKGYAKPKQNDDLEGEEGGNINKESMQDWVLSQEMAREVCISCAGSCYLATDSVGQYT